MRFRIAYGNRPLIIGAAMIALRDKGPYDGSAPLATWQRALSDGSVSRPARRRLAAEPTGSGALAPNSMLSAAVRGLTITD